MLANVSNATLTVDRVLVPLVAHRRERHAFYWPVGWAYEHDLPGILSRVVADVPVPVFTIRQ